VQLTVCVHTEVIPERAAFEGLFSFSRRANELGLRPVICVMTPKFPVVARMMAACDLDENGYEARLRQLSRHALLGYHGHLMLPAVPGRDRPAPGATNSHWRFSLPDLRPATTEDDVPELLAPQFDAEIGWLRERGLGTFAYSAGWWWLPSSVIGLLETRGFRFDLSTKPFDPYDTLGGTHRPRLERDAEALWLRPGIEEISRRPTHGAAEACLLAGSRARQGYSSRCAPHARLRPRRWA